MVLAGVCDSKLQVWRALRMMSEKIWSGSPTAMPLFLAPTTWMSKIHNNPRTIVQTATIRKLSVHFNSSSFPIHQLENI